MLKGGSRCNCSRNIFMSHLAYVFHWLLFLILLKFFCFQRRTQAQGSKDIVHHLRNLWVPPKF